MSRARIAQIARAVERALPKTSTRSVSLAFISNAQMRALNRQWRGKDRTTDVLSFGDDAGNGEILISYDVARAQAADLSHGILEEIGFLLVHGLLHLHGFDHIQPKDAKRMFPLQERILRSLSIDPRL